MAEVPVVHVEVHGQKYPIRTELDPKYVEELVQFVESRMALASKSSPSSDAVGLAILTALNITDEYFRTRNSLTNSSGSLAARTEALERMVDQALVLAEITNNE
jgi:cell division protein ZapA (FtsZ GTPase activity inhibitor)